MNGEPASPSIVSAFWCPSCGGEVGSNLLICPGCHWLVHSDRLKELAGSAEAAERQGDPSGALAFWQEAIDPSTAGEPPPRPSPAASAG